MEKRYHLAIWTTNPAADPAAKLLHTFDAWEIAKLRGMAAGAKPGQYVEIIDNQGSNGEAWTVPTTEPQPATPATENANENAKEDQTMTTATKEAPARSYYADRIETAGRAFTCTYRTEENGDIIADLITDGAPLAVVIPQDHPDHPAALAAATSDELPAMIPADPDEIHPETVRERLEDSGIVGGEVVDVDKLQAAPIVCAAMEQAEQIEQAEEAAPIINPEPIREPAQIVKPWAGEQIQGNGWRIVFDTTTARTRVIFDVQPAEEVKKAVAAAGFYWSAVMQSWNKGLTCKARRKAQQLAETLAAMIPAAV